METSERGLELIGLILQGAQRHEIEELAAQEGWTDQLAAALDEALAYFEDIGADTWEARRGWCIAALTDLYRKTIDTGDYTAAIRCVLEIAKLSKGSGAQSGSGKGGKSGKASRGLAAIGRVG